MASTFFARQNFTKDWERLKRKWWRVKFSSTSPNAPVEVAPFGSAKLGQQGNRVRVRSVMLAVRSMAKSLASKAEKAWFS
jgi:hypothetical protein